MTSTGDKQSRIYSVLSQCFPSTLGFVAVNSGDINKILKTVSNKGREIQNRTKNKKKVSFLNTSTKTLSTRMHFVMMFGNTVVPKQQNNAHSKPENRHGDLPEGLKLPFRLIQQSLNPAIYH